MASNDAQPGHGRTYEQLTKNGSSSAASMGAGGTGNSGSDGSGSGSAAPGASGQAGAGNAQQAGRTDDLLDDGKQQADQAGFVSEPGKLRTGMEGIGKLTGGAGNAQSAPAGSAGHGDDKKGG